MAFTDIHCHLLPGIDDGPADWDTTLAMARVAVAEGTDAVIVTPHQLGRYEANTADRIRRLAATAQDRLRAAGIALRVLPGADVRVRDGLPDLVHRGQVLTLGDHGAHLLIELPDDVLLPLEGLLYDLECRGVTCILSHPERHGVLMADPARVRAWVEQGCLLQVTAASITGHFGPYARRASHRLLRDGLVHLVATDAHGPARPPLLRAAFAQVCRLVGPAAARRLFVTNPGAVAAGVRFDTPLPVPPPRRVTWWPRMFRGAGGQR